MRSFRFVSLAGLSCSLLLLGLATASAPTSNTDRFEQRDLNNKNPSDPYPGYFKHHRFYDFRNRSIELSADGGEQPRRQQLQRRNITPRRLPGTGRGGIPGYIPDNLAYDFDSKGRNNEAGGAPDPNADSNEFHRTLAGSRFIEDWDIQNWNREGSALFPIPIKNSHHNVFIVRNSTENGDETTHMILRTERMEEYTSTAEVQTHDTDILHASLRVRLRLYANSGWVHFPREKGGNINTENNKTYHSLPTSYRTRNPPAGACAGVFTYYGRNDESDIEILTGDPPNLVRYANQPDWDPKTDESIPGASDEIEVSVPWTHWGDHRLDWFQDISRWYFNGNHLVSKTYGVPKNPSMLILNLWSDGGQWTGNMTVGSSVYMGVEWVEMVYNKTADFGGAHKKHARVDFGLETEDDKQDEDEDNEGAKAAADELPPLQSIRRAPRPKKKQQIGKGKTGDKPENKAKGSRKGKHKGKKPKTKPKPNGEDSQEEGCRVVCRIDGVKTQGIPEIA
ncbi:hypothetical protein MGYG_04880 [Nannizzia gypsea CBS 118893]|uniref:GH16 domain-containing protein n=1 Tax=Arthroderma gypseum (strain ATCC MYA-4604 / CBS 118893) TaxID=535722 RepID=E4UXD2_ARTGP|nr:hypothetical protein MGYG_04880 [Nannizzia gypsea CBS 118893]EFR01880.1 hypothetical protein MGYG_04880 [Nannizzia gypsea CBS 118893]